MHSRIKLLKCILQFSKVFIISFTNNIQWFHTHVIHDIISYKEIFFNNLMFFNWYLKSFIIKLCSDWCLITFYSIFEICLMYSLTFIRYFVSFICINWGHSWWRRLYHWSWLCNAHKRFWWLIDSFLSNQFDLFDSWLSCIFTSCCCRICIQTSHWWWKIYRYIWLLLFFHIGRWLNMSWTKCIGFLWHANVFT